MQATHTLTAEAVVYPSTGEPGVSFRIGDYRCSLLAQDARELALGILGAAERAELEAGLALMATGHDPLRTDAARLLELVRDAQTIAQTVAHLTARQHGR